MTVAELSLELGVKLEISLQQFPGTGGFRWRCHMHCVSLPAKQGHHEPPYGWGFTPESALGQYVQKIHGKTIEVHPYAHCEDHLRHPSFVPSDLTAQEAA